MIGPLPRSRVGGTLGDVVLVVALLAVAEAEAAANDYDVARWVVMLGAGLAVLPLLARRRAPIAAGTLTFVIALLTVVLAFDQEGGQLSMVLTVVTASYSVGAHAERWSIAWVTGAVLVMLVGMAVAEPSDIIFPALFFAFLPWLGGHLLRSHRALTRQLATDTLRAEQARADDRERAIARERARIARELHDVLAHNLSAIVVQAGAARRVLDRDPDAAGDAARLIADTGREALAELRHLSGAVRRDDADPLDGPPTLARVGDLVRGAREAGLDATLRVEGTPVEMPAGLELAGYRVVQEALTNAMKHAGPARAGVTVRYEPWEVVLEIIDDGAGASADAGLRAVGGGHGIVGMRERVGLYGGSVQAGPAPGGGYAVRARLPLAEAVVPA
jgi:signal transduction histidine kinase